jgi:hypothetical protein
VATDSGASGVSGDIVLPAYGTGALSDLLPSVLAALGVADAPNVLGLAPTRRACVFLVDGLGRRLIEQNAGVAPFLAAALAKDSGGADSASGSGSGDGGDNFTRGGARSAVSAERKALTAGFPSTTAASLGSLGTGLPPGAHGMLGYRVLVPGTNRMINLLRWDAEVDPLVWQRHETVFEHAVRDGIAVTQVTASRFEISGLTRSSLRGGAFTGAESLPHRVEGALAALYDAAAHDSRALVYLYYADLDAAGHIAGVRSDSWRDQLATVDATVKALSERLPRGTTLYVTADHGMVDVPADRRIDVDEDPELQVGLRLLGGEGRARHVYARPGAARDVLAIWRESLEGIALVRSRDEAIHEGWFGPLQSIDMELTPRIGDVVAALLDDWAVVATRREKLESRLFGMHGSLTADEQMVPLLEFRGEEYAG